MAQEYRMTLKGLFALGIFVAAGLPAYAQKSPSIMFGDPAPDLMSEAPAATSSADHCAELSRKISELKGSPQQRMTMSNRYQAECVDEDVADPNALESPAGLPRDMQ